MEQDFDQRGSFLMELYRRLYETYGPQHWWPGESQFEVVLGAILTQAAAWSNVEQALDRMKSSSCFSAAALRDVPESELAALIHPAGYFNAKAKKLKAFVAHLWEHYDGNLEAMLSKGDAPVLRAELLSIYGIGEETADDIVLYAAGLPSFVIDSYTRRVLARLGMNPVRNSYSAYQEIFHSALPADAALFNEYHALLDRHAKATCRKEPQCTGCCLLDVCPTGRDRQLAG